MIHRIVIIGWLLLSSVLLGCKDKSESQSHEQLETLQPIEIADNAHFFKRANGDPFFWLGDTAWLLLKKLDREAIAAYFDDRKKKGFNVNIRKVRAAAKKYKHNINKKNFKEIIKIIK